MSSLSDLLAAGRLFERERRRKLRAKRKGAVAKTQKEIHKRFKKRRFIK